MTGTIPSGTVTFLFTDVEGSTELWQEHPREMAQALARHDEIVRHAIEGHDGYVFSTAGDAFAAAFASALDAVAAASTAQAELTDEPWTVSLIRVRMGLNTGVAEERGGDYFGPVLNRTARIMALAHGNQVVLSAATAQLVRGDLEPTLELRDIGEHRLKSLRSREHLHQLMGPGLSAEQLKEAPEQGAGNLPTGVVDFVGRRGDIENLETMVGPGRLVTLTGVGGVGKTQLATRVGAAMGSEYVEGVWWCDLTPLSSAEMIPTAVASVLEFAMQPDMTPVESVVVALSRRRIVLVLDNCEHLLEGVAALVDAVVAGCPNVALLATSRAPIGTNTERVWPVQSLDVETEAVELLIQGAVAADASIDPHEWERADLVELCRRLDGIPLAIEMAAARLRSMQPRQVIERLDDRFRVLRSRRRGGDQRHQTLLATLDWSYDLLEPDERLLLDRLTIFAGAFHLEMSEAVCADNPLDDVDLADLLEVLVDNSLVMPVRTQSRTQFRLLETVRHYGLAHLEERGDSEHLQRKHALAHSALVDDAAERLLGERHRSGLQAFNDSWTDITAAMAWATSVGDSALVGRLMKACLIYGVSVPKLDLAQIACAAMELPDPPAIAFGWMSFYADGHQQIEYAEAGLVRPDADGWTLMMLFSQRASGMASTGSGGVLAAIAEAREVAYDHSSPVDIAYWEAITAESIVRRSPEVASGHAHTARLMIERARGNPRVSAAFGRLASYEALSGRFEDALGLCEQATSLADEAGFMTFRAYSIALAARISAVLEPAVAAPILIDAIDSARQSGWWSNVWPVMSGAGRWFEAVGNLQAAAVVDGYFDARGTRRDEYDLVPSRRLDLSGHGENRRLGAAMSGDEVVDFVLDELATAQGPV